MKKAGFKIDQRSDAMHDAEDKFRVLDVNKNGKVDEDSCVLVIYDILVTEESMKVGTKPNEKIDYQLMKQAKIEWQKLLVHDLNEDNKITWNEFKHDCTERNWDLKFM